MKNKYDVTIRVETDSEGLVSIRVIGIREVLEEDTQDE